MQWYQAESGSAWPQDLRCVQQKNRGTLVAVSKKSKIMKMLTGDQKSNKLNSKRTVSSCASTSMRTLRSALVSFLRDFRCLKATLVDAPADPASAADDDEDGDVDVDDGDVDVDEDDEDDESSAS